MHFNLYFRSHVYNYSNVTKINNEPTPSNNVSAAEHTLTVVKLLFDDVEAVIGLKLISLTATIY